MGESANFPKGYEQEKRAPSIHADRILVIQLRQIGDVLLTTPLLRALRQYYPYSAIACAIEASPARVLRGNRDVDDLLMRPHPATWRQELQFLRRVRQRRFDVVVDLMGNPRSAMMARVSGAKHRVAFARFPRSLCYTTLVDHRHDQQEYTVTKRLRLLEPLGIQATDLSLRLAYTPQERAEVEQFLRAHAMTTDELLICIDPTHRVPTRQWPGKYFSSLADLLSERLRARVLLLWGPGEKAYVEAIAAAAQSRPILIPEWGLHTLAALLARADLFVGCDSAPQHIAVSQRTPTLTIFGATRSINWLPPDPQHRAVALQLLCQPCDQVQCGPPLDVACLRTLTADTVFTAVLACHPWVPKLQQFQ